LPPSGRAALGPPARALDGGEKLVVLVAEEAGSIERGGSGRELLRAGHGRPSWIEIRAWDPILAGPGRGRIGARPDRHT
jgi:hypothetical protein